MEEEGDGGTVGGGDGEDEGTSTISVRNFLTARVQEINSLSVQIRNSKAPTCKGLAFQHVPKHMRRRAVSHNIKRLPKRLHGIHRSQVEKSSGRLVKKPKRPSRKYRRRKSNLLEEYNRRQRDYKWLETHMWHAKRFHVENKWGYKMPMAPTDKGYRALYRAAKSHCSMRDVSFYSCLELQGPVDLISESFSRCFAPKQCNPLSLNSEMYKDGLREGSMYFYKNSEYPFGYVGKLRFRWRRDMKALWLWVLPVNKEEVIEELCSEFDLDKELVWKKAETVVEQKKEEEEAMEVDSKSSKSKDSRNGLTIDEIKLEPKKLMTRPKWVSSSTNVILSDLEGVFNRIRLYGPLATRTVKETLQVLTPTQIPSSETSTSDNKCNPWWINYFSDVRKNITADQEDVWSKLKMFQDVPVGSVIPLTVRDPRIMIPQKRTMPKVELGVEKMEDDEVEDIEEPINKSLIECVLEEETSTISDSTDFVNALKKLHSVCDDFALEDEELRLRLVKEKMTDAVFSKRRSELLIPGSKIELGLDENQVPILLVHRPNALNFPNGGWDLIIPAGWAMQFWVAFSYRCVRALGFRDAFHYEFESGTIHASNEDGSMLPPDSKAGQLDAVNRQTSAETNYFKYPPAKRVNFIKLRCPFPFKVDWGKVLCLNEPEAEDKSVEQCFVLRDIQFLSELRRSIIQQKISEDLSKKLSTMCHKNQCLVGVKLTIQGKGLVEEGAVICIPTSSDFSLLSSSKKSDYELIQKPGDDTNLHNLRHELRKKHSEFLSTARNQRKRWKKRITTRNENKIHEQVKYFKEASQLACDLYDNEMKKLWLPDASDVLSTMDHAPIGFVEYGAECYSLGKQSGLGYCTLNGLLKLFEEVRESKYQGLVLVRCTRSSLAYRFARIQVCELS